MPIIASQSNTDFEKPTPGTVQAVCVFVNDIGLQPGEYQGEARIAHKIIISWEIAEKMKEGQFAGKPFMLSAYYTLSLHEKAKLRKDLEVWRGRAFTDAELTAFDVESIIGKNCLLSIVATDTGKRKVAGIMALPNGMTPITPVATTPSDKYIEWIERERSKAILPAVLAEDAQSGPSIADAPPF